MCDQWLTLWQGSCPYCGAPNDIPVDTSQGTHSTWHDCVWCCSPIAITITISLTDDTLESVVLERDDDA